MAEYYPGVESVIIKEDELPGCCGVNVLYEAEFGVDEDMVSFGKCLEMILTGDGDYGSHFGLALYSLSQGQAGEAKVLLEKGFEALTSFVSPSSGNTITLYGKKVFQPAAKPATRRRARRR